MTTQPQPTLLPGITITPDELMAELQRVGRCPQCQCPPAIDVYGWSDMPDVLEWNVVPAHRPDCAGTPAGPADATEVPQEPLSARPTLRLVHPQRC